MCRKRAFAKGMMLFGLALTLAACARFGGRSDRADKAEAGNGPAAAEADRDDLETTLRRAVRRRIEAAPDTASDRHGTLVRRRPYFCKEYDVYPDGDRDPSVLITETESRTAPYMASVKVAKQRYATKYRRNKDEARADGNFLRSTGVETLSYEYRGGRWTLRGSFLLIDKTEENIPGEWVPVQPQVPQGAAADAPERKGWWGRTWSTITGRD